MDASTIFNSYEVKRLKSFLLNQYEANSEKLADTCVIGSIATVLAIIEFANPKTLEEMNEYFVRVQKEAVGLYEKVGPYDEVNTVESLTYQNYRG